MSTWRTWTRSSRCYKVASDKIAQGGVGEVYRGVELDDHRDPRTDVAIKVSLNPLAWHGEAYFGRLLSSEAHVVQLRDAFPLTDGAGPARLVEYVLVFDWMPGGTVGAQLRRRPGS
jgi:serine/threonine protein kinase